MTSILAVSAVDRAGGAEIGLLRLLARLRDAGWAVTLTTPGNGPLRKAALAVGLEWAPLAVGGLTRGTGARALASWPRARRASARADVVYLNGTVAGRQLPALRARKGVLDLVAAAPRLRQSGVRVVVVGDDPFATDPHYTGLVARSPGVEHYGWVEGAAGMPGALDVLVVPSRAEPFGTVAAEALNAGTPVVATNVGGLPEVVEDGVTGRLVPPADPAALAAAVLDVLADAQRLGANGRERARRWHADGYADRVTRLIAPGVIA